MSRYYEITDGNLHVGWASEDYMFTKMDERVLKGEANFNFHVGDRDAVDVVPVKHGHWHIVDAYPHNIYCSECHTKFAQEHWEVWEDGSLPRKYCPNCGAKMDETCIKLASNLHQRRMNK